MRLSKVPALTLFLAIPIFTSPALAQMQCPLSGAGSSWGINSTGYIVLDAGASCMFSMSVSGQILSSSVAQRPRHGTLQQMDLASFVYTARPGYRGQDTFSVRARGTGTYSSGTSVITIVATLR